MATKDSQRRTESGTPVARAVRGAATWLGLVAAFAAGAGAGWLGGRVPEPETCSAHSGAATSQADETAATLSERMLALDPFVVNLLSEDASRYLKVRIELEAVSPALRTELESRLPQVRDGILGVLSAHDVADVTSFEGKALLKQDILERVNAVARGEGVRSVLFTEFVVQ